MIKNYSPNPRIFAFLYLFATPYCSAADNQSPTKEHHLVANVSGPEKSLLEAWVQYYDDISSINIATIVDLRNCQITTLPDYLHLPLAQAILLDGNQITTFPDSLDLPLAKGLSLDGNLIGHIPPGLKCPLLNYLSLQANVIYDIDVETFLAQFPSLQNLHLDQNPIDPLIIAKLRKTVEKQNRKIHIHAHDIGKQYDKGSEFRSGARTKKALK